MLKFGSEKMSKIAMAFLVAGLFAAGLHEAAVGQRPEIGLLGLVYAALIFVKYF